MFNRFTGRLSPGTVGRRSSFTVIVLLLGTATLPAAESRNILLLISDNQNKFDCGCYGNSLIQTPNIDRLAADGVRFADAFATTASCGPSRAVIYTGLYTHANGQYGHGHGNHTFVIKPTVSTVYRMLKDAGYHTALLGKQHTTPPEAYPFTFNPSVSGGDVMQLAELGGQFIREAGDEPFFLTIGYSDPHPTTRTDGAGWGIRRDYPGVEKVTYDPADVIVPPWLPDRPEVREGLAGYYQQITRMDQGIGRILQLLEESGKAEETLVVFTSDHGSSEPGAMANHYEPGVQVPFLVRLPGRTTRGSTNSALVTLADITPTLLDWAEVEPTHPLNGRSLLPILGTPDPEGWDEVFLDHCLHEVTMYYPMRTLRTRRYKLIWNVAWRSEFPHPIDTLQRQTWTRLVARGDEYLGRRRVEDFLFRDELELYDLQTDPDEVVNLAAEPKYADIRRKLAGRIDEICRSTGDPWMERHSVPVDDFGKH